MKKLIILCAILGWVLLALSFTSCKKESMETQTMQQTMQQTMHTVKYWINSDSAAIRYSVQDNYFFHYVSGSFDTTFTVVAPCEVLFIATSWFSRNNCGVSIDGTVVYKNAWDKMSYFTLTLD